MMVICERARVEELAQDLRAAGVEDFATPILHASISEARWVGMPPSPNGGTFDLHAPEGVDTEPAEWREYHWRGRSQGWNFTRDLVAFRA